MLNFATPFIGRLEKLCGPCGLVHSFNFYGGFIDNRTLQMQFLKYLQKK
jgi:hypothetical protein